MAYRTELDEYLMLLSKAMPEEYRVGKWHPEDMGIAVAIANDALKAILEYVPRQEKI